MLHLLVAEPDALALVGGQPDSPEGAVVTGFTVQRHLVHAVVNETPHDQGLELPPYGRAVNAQFKGEHLGGNVEGDLVYARAVAAVLGYLDGEAGERLVDPQGGWVELCLEGNRQLLHQRLGCHCSLRY